MCPKEQQTSNRLQLHGVIYLPDSFVLMLRYCANLKAIRYESTSFSRIVTDKSHPVIVAIVWLLKTTVLSLKYLINLALVVSLGDVI